MMDTKFVISLVVSILGAVVAVTLTALFKVVDSAAETRGRIKIMAEILETDRRSASKAAAKGIVMRRPPWLDSMREEFSNKKKK